MNTPVWLRAVGQGLKHYWRILILGLVWLALLAGLVISGLGDIAKARPNTGACRPYKVQGVPSRPPTQPAQLKPHSEPTTAIAFYQERNVAKRQIEYDVTDPKKVLRNGAPLAVSVGPFLSPANSRELKTTAINAKAFVKRSRVVLDVCLNRTDPAFGKPGSYSGVVSITDPRVALTDATFTVTMAYPWWQLVFAVLLAMLLPAVFYVWFLRGSFTSHPGLKLKHFQEWIFSRVALMSLGAGLAAAIGIFSATYARSEVWGSDYTAATALFGASFSAFVAAATGVTAAGMDKQAQDVATNAMPQERTRQPGLIAAPRPGPRAAARRRGAR